MKKRWRKRFKEREEHFRLLAEITPSAIFIHDGERYLYVNPPMEHITGYSKEELLSMKLWEIIHPDYREMVKDFARRRLLGEDVPSKYETKILTKDGRERWANIYARKVSYNEKSIVLGLAFDITDLKRAEEALRESEEKFRVIFENAGVGITLVDREGRLIDCNSHFRNFVGYTKEELIGKHWRIYTHPEDVERNLDIFEKMIKEKKVFVFEKRFKRKDGRILWGRVTSLLSLIQMEDSFFK
ncbi:MAG: PAS domain S-box protein [Caldisericia bacterium]|nr:PAS domain S-box protein [Caldisericia bacterium]